MNRLVLLGMGIVLFALAHLDAGAQSPTPRQTYGPWQYNQEKGYHYRKFEYKPSANDKEYKYEYVIYYNSDPKKQINNNWVYFYNPTTEKFWGRYPSVNHPQYGQDAKAGKEVWSVLPADTRQKDLYAIDQRQFPTPRYDYCPTVPMAADKLNLMSPPADLP